MMSYVKFPQAPFARAPSLTLQSLLFSISLLFSLSDFPFFFCVFPSFSKDFRGSAKRKPLLFGEKPLLFPKKQGLEGQGVGERRLFRTGFQHP